MSPQQRPPVVFAGRCDVMQHGAHEAALMVRGAGRPVRLIVNGAPPETVRAARRLLSQVAGRHVEVRGYTSDKRAQREAINTADVVVVNCRDENVGLTALDAIVAEVPVLVPDTCGIGRFLVESGRFDPRLIEHSVIRRADGEAAAPVQRWITELAEALDNPDTTRQRAAELREALVTALRTLQSAGESAADLMKAITEVRGSGSSDD
ncbi:glycosyl transferase family 1 [Herbihabitans rhizosphaerae]|uniref:Glycosyl transferase family 1 n=1 Tax=Herbihabitans rhizosphaerae TaxID=1872711 RepID=A0A4Q7KVM1_9PSEU|nr:glycosyltransferase [Herbihabitans rhizosphaerae]RZS40715.1 glycosyl transferase family 1 [Herbihabitans rhizosphaerae]